VQALPGLSAHAGHKWDPDLLLRLGEAVLVWFKEVASQQPDTQLRAHYDPASRSIHCEVAADGDMPARLGQLVVT
jgi:hypothetical protein